MLLIAVIFVPDTAAQSVKKRVDELGGVAALQHDGLYIAAPCYNQAPLQVLPSADQGPMLYGWMSHCDSWDKNTSNYGIYSFHAVAETRFEKVFATRNATAAADADGRLAGYYVLNYGGAISIRYFMFDADSGDKKVETSFTTSNTTDIYTQYAYTLAYNHSDATLYGEFFKTKDNDLAVCISSIDPLTGKATEVAEIQSGNVIFVALAFDNKGTLYGIGDDGMLYTISLADGATTLIGFTGIQPNQPQCAWFDNANNKIYWSALTKNLKSALYEINPATAATALVSDYPATTWLVGLYGDHTSTGKVAADITDLDVEFTANASLTGTVKFTAPTKAADGSDLSGDLNVSLFVDYTKLDDAPETIAPGASYSFETSFASGAHKIEAQLSNEHGYGDRARKAVYAGTDMPGPVKNLGLTLSGRTASLSWTAPEAGANGGWFDPSGLTYKIVRRPDNVTVATAHTSTTLTDEIPDDLGNWFYEVTSVTNVEGATAQSNRIHYGTAKKVPYKETFDTEAPLDLFTFVDLNRDGYYWKWKNGNMVDGRGEAEEAGDWMITPPIALTTDWIYKMTFQAHGFGTYYQEVAVAAVADKPEAAAMKAIGSYNIKGDKFITCQALVEITQNGNYYLGIQHATPPPSTSRDELYIDNIELIPFISTSAPASVANLDISQLPDNALRGILKFNAPEKAINGSPVGTISKIEIYRDENLIDTKTAATPGQEFSMEIELPQGNHTFNVIAYNESGRGHDSFITAFGGVDVPQAVTNLRYEWDPDNDLKATLKWDAPAATGVNGYPIDLEKLTYSVLAPMWGALIPSKTGLTEMQCEVTTSTDAQNLIQRGVQAVSAGGSGAVSTLYVNLGKPVPTPASESFPNGQTTYTTWSISRLAGNASWAISNSGTTIGDAQDNDNGFAVCLLADGTENGEGRLISPAYDFSATTPMYLHLWLFHNPDFNPATSLTVEYSSNGTDFIQLDKPISLTGEPGWHEHHISLSHLVGVRKALLGFRANLPDQTSRVIMDNIVIDNTSNLETLNADQADEISLEAVAGGITVKGASGLQFNAFTPDGRRVAAATTLTTGTETITLPAGIYIVKVGKTVAKITVK